jgi:hypothetical protein
MVRIAQIAAVSCQPTISPHIKVDEKKQIAHRRMVAGPGIRGIIAQFASLLPRFRVSDLTPYCWSEFWGALHRGNNANVYLGFDCVF